MKKFGSKKNIITIVSSVLGVILVAYLTLFVIMKAAKLNDEERMKLDDFSSHALLYLDEYDIENENSEPSELTKYLAYAVAYNYGENGKAEATSDELKQIIKDVFDEDLDLSNPDEALMSSYINKKYIFYKGGLVVLDRSYLDEKRITQIPTWLYKEKKASSMGGKMTVVYEKYKVANPYNYLNYTATNNIDVPELSAYLRGEGSYASLKRAVKNEDIDSVGEFVKELKITYKEHDGKLYIDKIE